MYGCDYIFCFIVGMARIASVLLLSCLLILQVLSHPASNKETTLELPRLEKGEEVSEMQLFASS